MTPFVKIHAASPENIIVMLYAWDASTWRVSAMTRNSTGHLVCYSEDFSTEQIATRVLKHTSAGVWETKLKEEMEKTKP